jgi:molybdopterin synthase catalytic subunit
MTVVSRLETGRVDPAAETAELLEQCKGDGAIVTFTGVARPLSKTGDEVEQLVLEIHPVLTKQSLEEIAATAAERFDVSQVRVVHRAGEIAPGDPIVFVAASSPHRRAAFEAADYLMDRLKTDAVFWKREVGASGSSWIEATDSDHSDRGRWE